MKNIITILLLLIPVLSFAQRIRVNEVDKFTKEKHIETKWFYIKSGYPPCMASAARKGKTIFLKLSISLERPFGTIKGDPCKIILKGIDKPLELESYYTNSATYTRHWYCHFHYALDEGQLNQILNNQITDIRIALSDNRYVDIEGIHKGKSDKIIEALEMVIGKSNITTE